MKKLFFLFEVLFAWTVFAQLPEYLITGNAPSPLEKKAEEELCYFYKTINHKPIKKITASQVNGKPAIYLGRTAYAKAQNINAEKFDQEEWLLKTCGFPVHTVLLWIGVVLTLTALCIYMKQAIGQYREAREKEKSAA